MKQILIILGLFASVSTFAQSPRIKLNQITKDTVKGSVLISSPSDSGMVYSRDFYVAYGLTDTVLILYGDTLAATSGIISSVLSDGVTITGNGTSGNELKVDTSLIATIKALNDSLATISASTTPDGVTITGDGSVGNPLKVDTATVISTIQGLVDTLTARGYLTANQTITLSGDVTGSGTTAITATVVDDSHDHIISNVDFLQDSLDAKANDSDLANYVTLSGADTITGAKTFTNTFTQSGGDANFDSGTLFVDESANRVGIGTNLPATKFNVENNIGGDTEFRFFNTSNGTGARALMRVGHSLNEACVFYTTGSSYSANTSLNGYANFQQNGGLNGFNIISYNGNISFQTNGTNERMQIKENGDLKLDPSTSGASSGNAMSWSSSDSTIYFSTSSIRFKENISDYDKGISTLMQMKPVYFNYKTSPQLEAGFIAEDIENIGLNEYITKDGDGLVFGLRVGAFKPLIVKAIQEQQTIIETQQSEIDQLKTLITDLTNRLTILENK